MNHTMNALSALLQRNEGEAKTDDYTGEDGLLHCGKCHAPRQMHAPDYIRKTTGESVVWIPCDCEANERATLRQQREQERREQQLRTLKVNGFSDVSMESWNFRNDNGRNPQMGYARNYVTQWRDFERENIGLLLWGKVGTGKSFFAGCIANALMEQGTAVCMTNFSRIVNDLNGRGSNRNDVIDRLCSYPLLIIDDFGMEHETDYTLEQIYNIVDSRYRNQRPLIVTTNLALGELKDPQDVAHARIYDRLLEMCVPICFTGENFRRQAAAQKMAKMQAMMKQERG